MVARFGLVIVVVMMAVVGAAAVATVVMNCRKSQVEMRNAIVMMMGHDGMRQHTDVGCKEE